MKTENEIRLKIYTLEVERDRMDKEFAKHALVDEEYIDWNKKHQKLTDKIWKLNEKLSNIKGGV